jgi:hypothetical protein
MSDIYGAEHLLRLLGEYILYLRSSSETVTAPASSEAARTLASIRNRYGVDANCSCLCQ